MRPNAYEYSWISYIAFICIESHFQRNLNRARVQRIGNVFL